jgi:hypothetical protein
METLGNEILQKSAPKYYCKSCNYSTSRKSSYKDHLLSAKHINGHKLETNGNENLQKFCKSNYECEKCKKVYQTNAGLWKHNKKCIALNNSNDETNKIIYDSVDKNQLILMLIKQNSELIKETSEFKTLMIEQQNMMLEVIKNGTNNNNNNTTNSHNKAFNLQFFLNETCKDAMNITDFIDSIKLQLCDLERVGELGFVDGISNIIVKNLKELDVTERPIHCTDKKREVLYVKDEDKWEKDEDKNKIKKAIKRVANKNIRLLPAFKEKYPDCNKSTSNHSDQYNKIIVESMDTDVNSENKIIAKISKEVIVQKENDGGILST